MVTSNTTDFHLDKNLTVTESSNTLSTYSNAFTHTNSDSIHQENVTRQATDASRSITQSIPSLSTQALRVRQPAYIITQLLKRRNRQAADYLHLQQQQQHHVHQQQQQQQQRPQQQHLIGLDRGAASSTQAIISNRAEVHELASQQRENSETRFLSRGTGTEEGLFVKPNVFEKIQVVDLEAKSDDGAYLGDACVDKALGIHELKETKVVAVDGDFNNINDKRDNDDDGLAKISSLEKTVIKKDAQGLDTSWGGSHDVFVNYDEIFPFLNHSSKEYHHDPTKSWGNLRDVSGHEYAGPNNNNNFHTASFADQDSFLDPKIFEKPPAQQSLKMSLVVGIFVAVGGFLYGYDTGLINSLNDMPYVTKHFTTNASHTFTSGQQSIIVSSLSIGTFIGALIAPLFCDKYGRRPTVMCSTFVVLTIGNTIQICSSGITMLCIGRFVSGVGVGLISAVVPLYQAETVHKSVRGAIISSYQWSITWGLLISSAVSQGARLFKNSASFRVPIGLQYVWILIVGTGMYFLPESPRYYVLKDQLNLAAESLAFLRGVPVDDTGLLEELVEVKANYDYEASFQNSGWRDCFVSSPSRYKQTLRIITGISVQAFQQFSGINFIFYYGVSFFSRAGFKNSYLISFITYVVNVVCNVPGLFLIDMIGRRNLLISGAILMCLSNFVVGIIGTVLGHSVISAKIRIAFICLFIGSFSATWGGCVWVVSAELFPLGVRAKCASISAASNWLANVICAAITPYLVTIDTNNSTSTSQHAGSNIFFIWSSLNLLAGVVAYFLVYETSGLTLEEVDELYKKSSNSRKSVGINKEIKLDDSHLMGFLSLAKNYNSNKCSSDNTKKHNKQSKNKNKKKLSNKKMKNKLRHPANRQSVSTETTNVEHNIVDLASKRDSDIDFQKVHHLKRLGAVNIDNGGVVLKNGNFEPSNAGITGDHDHLNSDVMDSNQTTHSGLTNADQKSETPRVDISFAHTNMPNASIRSPRKHYVDLGHGLELNAHNRGPPSLFTEDIELESSILATESISSIDGDQSVGYATPEGQYQTYLNSDKTSCSNSGFSKETTSAILGIQKSLGHSLTNDGNNLNSPHEYIKSEMKNDGRENTSNPVGLTSTYNDDIKKYMAHLVHPSQDNTCESKQNGTTRPLAFNFESGSDDSSPNDTNAYQFSGFLGSCSKIPPRIFQDDDLDDGLDDDDDSEDDDELPLGSNIDFSNIINGM